jgi:hypothetical protein
VSWAPVGSACADGVEPLQIRVRLQSTDNKTPEEVQAIKASHRLPSRQGLPKNNGERLARRVEGLARRLQWS